MSALALLTVMQFTAVQITADLSFPERMPQMIELCLENAVDQGLVTQTSDSHKYICSGNPAEELWLFLEAAEVESYKQHADEGIWLSREFPLGGCFKLVENDDGSEPDGLSCTLWIPRPIVERLE